METSKEFSEEHLPKITLEQCKNFCKNASKIAVQYGTSLSSEFNGNNLKVFLNKFFWDEMSFFYSSSFYKIRKFSFFHNFCL